MQEKKTGTYDQTWTPLSSVLQMICISVSLNLTMHFFCSFSTVWIIPEIQPRHRQANSFRPAQTARASEGRTAEGGHILDGGAESHCDA